MYLSRKLNLIFFLLLLQISSQGQDIIAHYPFDNNAMDISGNNNSGSLVNGVGFNSYQNGGYLTFDGSDDYISVPYASSSSNLMSTTGPSVDLLSIVCQISFSNR